MSDDSQRERLTSVASSTSSSDSVCMESGCIQGCCYDAKCNNCHPYEDITYPVKPNQGGKLSNGYKRAAMVALALSIVCLLGVLSCGCCMFYFYAYGDSPLRHGGAAPRSENERVCLPCDHITPDPTTQAAAEDWPIVQQLASHVDEKDRRMCCAYTPAQYAALFKLILRRQEEVKQLSDVLGSRANDRDVASHDAGAAVPTLGSLHDTVSAHLLLKPFAPQFTDPEGNVVQQWKSPTESPSSHMSQGLKFHDHKIYVQTSGYYFVYCQILYHQDPTDHLIRPKLASTYVTRRSLPHPSTTSILLKARHTRGGDETDRHSSYVGGLFLLQTGDQLFVQVAVPEIVSHDDKASFFGLYRVGN